MGRDGRWVYTQSTHLGIYLGNWVFTGVCWVVRVYWVGFSVRWVVKVWGYGGRTIQVRALLDTGAQGCIVSSKLVSRLGLNVRPSEDEAVGIGGLNVPDIRGQTNFEFALGSTCTGVSYQVSAVVLDEVVGKLPQEEGTPGNWFGGRRYHRGVCCFRPSLETSGPTRRGSG
ncbi:aspartyl protease domain-containing protein [Phthorimaea operculella]|nr:aspartyl protease domain-containing protein [Phthorimaea operculella]